MMRQHETAADLLASAARWPQTQLQTAVGPLTVRVEAGRLCRFDLEPTNAPHYHNAYYEFCLVLAGHGRFDHGGQRHDLAPGLLFVADPGVVHEISSHETRDLALVFFTLEVTPTAGAGNGGGAATAAPEDARLLTAFAARHAVCGSAWQELEPYVWLLGRAGSRLTAARRRQLLLEFALDAVAALSEREAAPRAAAPPPELLHRAVQYIWANATRRLWVEEVARAMHTSPRHLRRLFQDNLHCRVGDYLREARMHAALRFLAMRFSVGEVARQLGIDSQAQFCREFRRQFGITPKAWQRQQAPRGNVPCTRLGELPAAPRSPG